LEFNRFHNFLREKGVRDTGFKVRGTGYGLRFKV
jgi:hypothetical protein